VEENSQNHEPHEAETRLDEKLPGNTGITTDLAATCAAGSTDDEDFIICRIELVSPRAGDRIFTGQENKKPFIL
jgi:hypothetical protein